jgi:hypothetical protein
MFLVECVSVLGAVFLAFTVPGTESHFFERFERSPARGSLVYISSRLKENRGSTAGGPAQFCCRIQFRKSSMSS